MTELPMNEIKGLMVDNLISNECTSLRGLYHIRGWNEAITEQGQRKIRANREKLAKIISTEINKSPMWSAKLVADAISEKLGYILEFVWTE